MRRNSSKDWNYHPDLPLEDKSIFFKPLDLLYIFSWLKTNWLTFSERIIVVIISALAWYFLYPPIHECTDFKIAWIFEIWIVNLLLMIVFTGLLHWYFYMARGQAKRLKFDHRDLAKNNSNFLFNSQVRDNMFWSLVSGVTFWTFFQVISFWLFANQYIPTLEVKENYIWFLVLFVLIPIWSALHFYWIHRLLHIPFFYKKYHSLHHRNINVGPWSGFSMHPVEHLFYLSTICIHWVVASHPLPLVFHSIYQSLGAAMSHTGYEELLIKDKKKLALGTFYHQLHHRYFECNYGNQEMPWDRWFGTFHDGSYECTEHIRARKRKIFFKN